MESKINFNYTQLIREIKSTFECKIHPNTKFCAYCSPCKLNICEKCLRNDSLHIGHQIFLFTKMILSEKHTKYYQTLYFFCKYYLNCVKEIVVELLSDLSDLNIKEKKLIIGLKSQLKSAYKFFHKINLYQMYYTKFILTTYLNCKKLGYFNYQIIQNVYSIKINSVQVPDLDEKDIINKVKTMIDFLNCTNGKNYILKDLDGVLPDTVYSYVDYSPLKSRKINVYSVKPPTIDTYIKNGEIYEPKEGKINSDDEQNEQLTVTNKKTEEDKEINNENNEGNNKSENDTTNKNSEKKDSTKICKDNANINNSSVNSETNESQKKEENNNNIKIKNVIQIEDKKISTSSSPKHIIEKKTLKSPFMEESKSKSTPPFQSISHNPQTQKKINSKTDSLYSSQNSVYDLEEEVCNKCFNDKKNQYNNKNIKKFIFDKFPKICPDEVEYRDNVQYIYHDKVSNRDMICNYFGEFKKGTMNRHGRGLFIWEDGEKYMGYWVNDKREGQGKNTYTNGNKYEGSYKNGKKEGFGIYKWENGDSYSGNWKNDMKEGKGTYKFHNGDVYEGMFKNDKINGKGKYIWANKIQYEGQFKNNTIEKDGVLKYTFTKYNEESKKEDFKNDEKNEINIEEDKS